MTKNAEEHGALAAAAGNTQGWQEYREQAVSEDHDKSMLGRPIPILLLGFGAPAARPSLATELIRAIIASRKQLSAEYSVYFPGLGISDGQGSFSPHSKMPRAYALAAGLSDVGMMSVAVETVEEGRSLRGNGYANTHEVVEYGGHRGCVLLDLSEDKKAQTKALAGLLHGAQQGHYAVVVGKRSEAQTAAVARAFPPDRLLCLRAADLAPAGEGLQARAMALLRRIAGWYLEREEVQKEMAVEKRAKEHNSRPIRRRKAAEVAQQVAEQAGDDGNGVMCPCGCGQAEVQEHMAGILSMAMANPPNALQRFEQGDPQMGTAIGNLVGVGVGNSAAGVPQHPEVLETYDGQRLLQAATAQLAAARQQRDYTIWRSALLVASNCCRFNGDQGEVYRQSLLDQGLGAELVIAQASKDSHVRDMARQTVEVLEAFEAWQRQCAHCARAEPPQRDSEGDGGEAVQAEGRLKLCSVCRSRGYCGRECQMGAWKEHKKECKLLAAL